MDDYADHCEPPLPQAESRLLHEPSALHDLKGLLEIDVRRAGIASVVWASGYACDFSWIKIPLLDANGDPIPGKTVYFWFEPATNRVEWIVISAIRMEVQP